MDLSELNPKGRFSNRVENYVKYRPNYPNDIIKFLNTNASFTKELIVADIGSGTGISSKLFLDNGNQVYGIEPNADMRRAGEKFLNNYTNFTSIDASSENTNLESESVDIIVCGQSFHWFEPEPTKKEFFRILKPDGFVVIINNRRKSGSEFMNEYVELIRKYSDSEVSKTFNTNFSDFFGSKTIYKEVFNNSKTFNLEILQGDLLSYSYIPSEEKKIFSTMISVFELLFKKHNKNGNVIFDYETVLYLCKMK
ncbi:class I SAM-dependent methyltransferase [Neobacillus massiliamazoniensis]|uniref:Methyltransferase n=1 Tax=Neobacillus massiliamazoniensis TaxID=1499688 RepID=A0A0U1NYP2_9BACI|nr:class I SAM-dependent methyltransferase [Neobacillus massiliamazoniensis]CRK83135.1 methyltransferase [Neobacillus massiliamazoniensis]